MTDAFELSTDIFSLSQLRETDLSVYDAFYLGNPFCDLYEGNLSTNRDFLLEASDILKREGKRIYLVTHAVPRNSDLENVEKVLSLAEEIEADGIEAHNMGVIYLAFEKGVSAGIHTGAFANVYTQVTARYLKEWGVVRVRPNVEVSFEEMCAIKEEAGVEVTVVLHGKIPLGVVSDCFFLEEKKDASCPEACLDPAWLKRRDWVIMHVGRGVYSGLDFCLIEHLDRIVKKGFRVFRIEAGYESADYRNCVGRVYRESLEAVLSGGPQPGEEALRKLVEFSRIGHCNGYFFGTTGRKYFDRAEGANV